MIFLFNTMIKFCSSTIIYYLIAGFIIFFSMDVKKVKVNRLNYLKDSASFPVSYLEGRSSFDERQFRYARRYYQTLIDLVPVYEKSGMVHGPTALSRAYAMIALCDYYLGKNEEAITLLQKAIQIEPKHFWLNYNLGVIYFKLGNYETALSYLKEYLSLNKEKLALSMQLDYYDRWEPRLREEYKKVSVGEFYQLMVNSYKLSILAHEQLKNSIEMKKLASVAIRLGLAPKDGFFYYYADLSTVKPEVGKALFDLVFNPSLHFVPIGQEKYLAKTR